MTKLYLALLSIASVFLMTSCQKDFEIPLTDESIDSLTTASEEKVADSVIINFLWVKTTNQYSNLIGARFELRDEQDSLILSVLDIMNNNDSVFIFEPHKEIPVGNYKLLTKSPTGMIIDNTTLAFEYDKYLDEIVMEQSNVTYFMKFTWTYPNPFKTE